ncbi:MAG: YlxR family protein [Oscillospiraceae bacterium]|nr:YlxR family protein [Oscillospiraceae bacterium]
MLPQNTLLRAVKPKAGDIAVDVSGKADGRGAYVCRCSECVNRARKMRRLEKTFKCKVSDEIYDILGRLCDGGTCG